MDQFSRIYNFMLFKHTKQKFHMISFQNLFDLHWCSQIKIRNVSQIILTFLDYNGWRKIKDDNVTPVNSAEVSLTIMQKSVHCYHLFSQMQKA